MELALLIGIPASGKSTFCRERFFGSHLRLSLDMLRTRRRERGLFQACLETRTRAVIDNTNASPEERALFIAPARQARFRIVGYYLSTDLSLALARNKARAGAARVPDVALLATHSRLRLPNFEERFDELFFVTDDGRGGFTVEPWRRQEEGAQPIQEQVLAHVPIYKDREL